MPSNLRRLLASGLIGAGVALGLLAAPGLTPPAAAATGTLAFTPASGTVSAKPFATFTASACPGGYGESAKLSLVYTTKTITLVQLTGPGLDTRALTADMTDSLSTIFIKNAIFTIASGAYPVQLQCAGATGTEVTGAEGTLTVAGANWTFVAVEPSASPSNPSPSNSSPSSPSPSNPSPSSSSPSPQPSSSSPSPSPSSPSPDPSESQSEEPSESPSPTPSDSTSPTPTPTATDDDDDDDTSGGGGSDDDLPLTGPAAAAVAAAGLGLVVAGAGILFLTRRRPAGAHS